MSTIVKIDSRLCVKRTDTGFNINRQDISIPDAIEILARILFCIRSFEFRLPPTQGDERNVIDSFEYYPNEPTETPKVCIAFDYETHRIQVSVIGLSRWDACALLNIAQSYLTNLQLGLITE